MRYSLLFAASALLLAACLPANTGTNGSTGSGSSASGSAVSSSALSEPNGDGLVLEWSAGSIMVDGVTVVTIDDFADEVEVDEDIAFGSSDVITGAVESWDGQWIAISVRGAAHDFGWLYNVAGDSLRPVVFQYGGGVRILGWTNDSRFVDFEVETPEPAFETKRIDTQNLPEYPRVPADEPLGDANVSASIV